MKYLICIFVFAICVADAWGQESPPPPPPLQVEFNTFSYEPQHSIIRIARQAMPEPPPEASKMTPPPDMPKFPPQPASRKRREARGVGGSIPTRKG